MPFHKLPSKVQKRVSELIEEFQHDPQSPAIGLHPLPGTMLDPKVRGVKKLPDGYRAIVIAPEKGDTYLLVHIDAHDKAYDWAKNKRFEVHGMTGVFQVFDAEEVQSVVQEAAPTQPSLPDYPLARLSDDELFEAGVPKPLVPAVRSIRNDDGLDALSDYLPPDCRDVLFGLAAGMTLQQAIDEMLGVVAGPAEVAPESPGDFTKIQETPNFDLVLVAGEEELKQILEGTLEEWRIFLHPYQRKLIKWKTKGPMNITGSAGTGKTVALMHRAVHLARQLEALRLIRAISPIDEGTPDPLCTVGDGHQRIYRTKIPMSRAGIDIRGRSRRLKINYRTSEQIRKFAQGILKGLEIDDLDGGIVTTIGDHSVFKGPEPVVEKCKTEMAEAEAIVAWVQMLMKDYGLATHEICVTPRRPKIVTALTSADIATFELKPREEDPGSDEAGIRVGTMKRIKGLEFRAVAMACAHKEDPMNHLDDAELRHRCERYVAATRAREHLLVTVSTSDLNGK